MVKHGARHERALLSRSSSFSKIRIHFEYIDFDLGTTKLNDYFKTTLMGAANSFFTNTIKTYSVQGNIIVDETSCDVVDIPSSHQKTGVADTDLVVYVSSISEETEGYIAYAGPCTQDTKNRGMPTSGILVINKPYFVDSDFASHYSTVTHEMYHIFGFNSGLYDYWTKPDGSSYSEVTSKVTIRGASKLILKTPNVIAKAKEAFGCSTIQGIELEEYGGEGTAGSHWDMRIMYNDFMMGKDIENPIYSTITLALLKDSGWYDVDYTYVTQPMFGNGAGCDFFDKKCVSNGKSNFPSLFCDDPDLDLTCDTFALRKSKCYIGQYDSNLPSAFQYFSNKKVGGDSYCDYCPTFRPYSDGDCRSSSVYMEDNTSEKSGANSRCFQSTLSTKSTLTQYAACYEVLSCSSTGAIVQVGTNKVTCPFTGGSFSVTGFKGKLTCPSSKVLCKNIPCPDGCSGRGKCVDGVCKCDSGYSGTNCLTVSSGSACGSSCSTCSSGKCTKCKTAFYLSSGSCKGCPTKCSECTSSTKCTKCKTGYKLSSGACK
jgi:leishmanolysin